jgi:hypothetical protein
MFLSLLTESDSTIVFSILFFDGGLYGGFALIPRIGWAAALGKVYGDAPKHSAHRIAPHHRTLAQSFLDLDSGFTAVGVHSGRCNYVIERGWCWSEDILRRIYHGQGNARALPCWMHSTVWCPCEDEDGSRECPSDAKGARVPVMQTYAKCVFKDNAVFN